MAGPHPGPQGPNQMALLGAASCSLDQGIGWNCVQPTACSRSTAVAERYAPQHTIRLNNLSPPSRPPCLLQQLTACTTTLHALCPVPNSLFELPVPGHLGDFRLVVVSGEAISADDSARGSPDTWRQRFRVSGLEWV